MLTNNGTTNFAANTGTSGPVAITLASATIGATGQLTIGSSLSHTNRSVLVAGGLTFAAPDGGQVDLKDNDMIVHNGDLSAITASLKSGFAINNITPGYWNGPGIASSTAASDPALITTLGVIKNDDGSGNAIYSTTLGNPNGSFDGQSTVNTDVLIKFTYYGDANLNGVVDSGDYTMIDNGFGMSLTGWVNGDFNYDGFIDGSDYSLIDNAFNTQGGTLAARAASQIATNTSEIAGGSAVPEPSTLGLLTVGAIGLLNRRTRKQ